PITAAGETVTWTITRPPTIPEDSFVQVDLTIDDSSKATFALGQQHVTVYLEPGQTTVQVPITGESDGTTTVTIDANAVSAPGRPYHGTSTIFVGSGVQALNIRVHV